MRTLTMIAVALVPAVVLAADEPVIGQKERMFSQTEVTVQAGGSVQFLNDDDVSHNLTVNEPDGVTRPGVLQPPGGDTRLPFAKFGDHSVRCLIHPKMKLIVHVH